MKDLRRDERLQHSLLINYQPIDSPGWSSVNSIDISTKGLRLKVFQNFAPGVRLGVNLYLRKFPVPIVAIARVVWIKDDPSAISQNYEVGLEFLDIDPSDVKKINFYMDSIRQEESFNIHSYPGY